MEIQKDLETATLGGGCFWCLEAVFSDLEGVASVESGYSGGNLSNPSYQQVCSGTSGHAEVVRVTFDPAVISFSQILEIFFSIHDPTTLNRQGADVGPQYRSVIFYHNLEQKKTAEQVIREMEEQAIWARPIVTSARAYGDVLQGRSVSSRIFLKRIPTKDTARLSSLRRFQNSGRNMRKG